MNRHAGYLIAGALVALGALLTVADGDAKPPPTTTTLVASTTKTAPTTTTTTTTTTPMTTTTTVPPSPTSTTTTPSTEPAARLASVDSTPCAEWLDLAARVGWPAQTLDRVGYIAHRESRCDPSAYNAADPHGGSRGLMQINGYWCKGTAGWPAGFVQTEAGLDACDDLFDPEANLRAALAIYEHADERGCGWSPWATRNTRWCS